MTRTMWLIVGLAVVNIALLVALVKRTEMPAAQAQMAAGGSYIFASGQGSTGGVLYVLNTNTGMLSGFMSQGNDLQRPIFLAPHSVSADIKRIESR